jgi:chromatin assembly factor 1 subunit A
LDVASLQSPEMLKIKLKLLELEFEEEMKQKTERLKPRLFGCVWVDSKTADSGMLLLHL